MGCKSDAGLTGGRMGDRLRAGPPVTSSISACPKSAAVPTLAPMASPLLPLLFPDPVIPAPAVSSIEAVRAGASDREVRGISEVESEREEQLRERAEAREWCRLHPGKYRMQPLEDEQREWLATITAGGVSQIGEGCRPPPLPPPTVTSVAVPGGTPLTSSHSGASKWGGVPGRGPIES